MPHQNPSAPAAGQQNATTSVATESRGTNQQQHGEPRTYAAEDVRDSTLAPPAAGEISDFTDQGDALDQGEALSAEDVQQGGDHTNRPYRTEAQSDQGPKTKQANRERLKG